MTDSDIPQVGSIWQHYKGSVYAVVGHTEYALHVETRWAGDGPAPTPTELSKFGEYAFVAYAKEADHGVKWYQPLERWHQRVGQGPRFAPLDIALILARTPPEPFDVRAANALAHEVDQLVRRKVLDSRSLAADALLDYVHGEPDRLVRAAYVSERDAVVRAHEGTRAEVHKLLMRNRELMDLLAYERAIDTTDFFREEANRERRYSDILRVLQRRARDPANEALRLVLITATAEVDAAREKIVADKIAMMLAAPRGKATP